MSPLTVLIWLVIVLIGIFFLTALNAALRQYKKKQIKRQPDIGSRLFFYQYFHRWCLPGSRCEELFFVNSLAQHILRFLYAILAFIFVIQLERFQHLSPIEDRLAIDYSLGFLILILLFALQFLIGDYLAKVFGTHSPQLAAKLSAAPSSLFMTLALPFAFLILKISHRFVRPSYINSAIGRSAPIEFKQELIELIEESDLSTHLDPHDKKLIAAMMSFKDRIVREVMVPRVEVFSLPHTTTIEEAAVALYNEGYSRTPVYRNTLDNIVGILMYRDILYKYMECVRTGNAEVLKTPIIKFVKPVLYTPESKKISQLLQEFRKKQVHLAVIVDEYGGTEGIVTIEDILEEIVGDIADEYDEEQELFTPLSEGGWLVDARMNISSIKEHFDIDIPQHGDYDTIGGYLFHETGMIPPKGFVLQKPHYVLEVLRSNNRRVEKLRLRPVGGSDLSHSEVND